MTTTTTIPAQPQIVYDISTDQALLDHSAHLPETLWCHCGYEAATA